MLTFSTESLASHQWILGASIMLFVVSIVLSIVFVAISPKKLFWTPVFPLLMIYTMITSSYHCFLEGKVISSYDAVTTPTKIGLVVIDTLTGNSKTLTNYYDVVTFTNGARLITIERYVAPFGYRIEAGTVTRLYPKINVKDSVK